ncbi:MAG TPA: hypothetical protein VFV50_09145 [Bdellovibrionales bacterium]|nr:hypothetical protein [Bdellovibrionales bacterium]
MRKSQLALMAAVLLLAGAPAAFAAKAAKTKAAPPSNTRSVEIQVPELTQTLPAQQAESAGLPDRMAVMLSSFKPKAITLESRISASEFEARGLPQVSAAYHLFLGAPGVGDLYAQAGAGYQSFERHGNVGVSTVQFSSNQQLYMIPMRVGLALEPRALRTGLLRASVGLSALPTLAMTEESAISEDRSYFATAYELSAGLSADISRAFGRTGGAQGLSLGVNVAQSFGGSSELDFNTLAIQAGVVWPFN